MTKETGGPAFPQNTKIVAAAGQELHQGFIGGMTLRDYFAAKAMQAILSDKSWHGHTCRTAALESYEMADEMIKARSNT